MIPPIHGSLFHLLTSQKHDNVFNNFTRLPLLGNNFINMVIIHIKPCKDSWKFSNTSISFNSAWSYACTHWMPHFTAAKLKPTSYQLTFLPVTNSRVNITLKIKTAMVEQAVVLHLLQILDKNYCISIFFLDCTEVEIINLYFIKDRL